MNPEAVSPPAAAAVDLHDVSLWRDRTRILDHLSWHVNVGEHWAVIGPNGCGKTTLLNIVSGWLFPSAGTVTVLGQRFGKCNLADLRPLIGFVANTVEQMLPPELLTLGVVLTGKDASLGIREEPAPPDLELAHARLAEVGCAQRGALPFRFLSTGEQMRVLIARALMRSPRLLILDEPCTGLDPVARDVFLALVQRLCRRQGTTLLLVTHHLDEVVPAVTHVLALRQGAVVAAGPKSDVLTSAVLEQTFGVPFSLRRDGDRYHAHPRVTGNALWHLG